MMWVMVSAVSAANFFYIFNTETTGKNGNGQEETDNQDRNGHKNPRDIFESAVTESLENTGTKNSYHCPPGTVSGSSEKKLVENSGNTH
jgi:hypothetical protein